jgi:O-Antigen ligase
MRAEQALTERVSSGPGGTAGLGASQAWRARLAESSALLAPIALVGGLALAGGGYEVGARHVAGLATWLVVVALILLGTASRAAPARPFYWAAGLIAGLSLLSAMSSLWSGSVELSVIEADRVLVYLGVFLAAFLIAQTEEAGQRFAEGLAISVVFVALLGLGSRLLPHVVEVSNGLGSGPRLRYPLGYWNANGAIFGIAAALILWSSRNALSAAWRGLSVALLPAVLLALYFTYSRGGLVALAIATGCVIALSRDRLWLLATLAIGAIGALPAVLAVQARRALAENLNEPAAVDQGVTVLLILLAGIAVSVLLVAALRWAERREGGLTGQAVALSRDPRLLRGLAVAIAVAAIGIAIAIGGRAWDRFSEPDVQFPNRPEAHITDFNGAGRHDFYRVALDTLGEKPLLGSGAGTYEFDWERRRSIAQPVHNAHSLYFESFAELGAVGGLLVLGLVGLLLWTGFAAWRAAAGAARERYAALLAVCLTFAVVAGFDWFWEIGAVGAVFFLSAGALVAARCRRLVAIPGGPPGAIDEPRFGLAVAALALAWITAVALIGPLLVDREIDASQSAAARGDIPSAVDHAETARSIEPFAASPYVQLGLLAEAQGEYPLARQHFTQAIDREDRNWQLYYLRSRVEEAADERAAAQADLEEARRLNPLEDCLRGEPSCG